MKTFSFRLYPSQSQREHLAHCVEVCRLFYNHCLEKTKESYDKTGKFLQKKEVMRLARVFKADNPCYNVHSHALQVAASDLCKTMDALFRRKKAGEKVGFPRFRSINRFHSFGLKELGNGFRLDGRCLHLTNVGRVHVRWHRKVEGDIKTLRVVCKNGKWFANLTCDTSKVNTQLPSCEREVGIDLGLTHLMTTTDGEHVENPRWYRTTQEKLARLQQSVSRKKKGGSNRRKAVNKLARLHEHIANQRKDFLEKLSYRLVRDYGRIAVEQLAVAKMAKERYAKSILDAGWSFFTNRLSVKAANAGRRVLFVDPAYTSQTCSGCGERQVLDLSVRWYTCGCGLSLCRDENAARNILRAGRALWSALHDQEAAGL